MKRIDVVSFSIIMPVYNVQEFLAEAIESILNQTYPNFELILINDGSTDESKEIAEKFALKDRRIKLLNQSNSGLSSSRNKGISYSSGNYLIFIDSDDWVKSTFLTGIKGILDRHPFDIVAYGAETFLDYPLKKNEYLNELEKKNNFYQRRKIKEGKYHPREFYHLMINQRNFVPSACMFTFRKEILEKKMINFYPDIINEDELFTRQILFGADSLYFTKEDYYKRRIREGSITQIEISKKNIISYLIISEEIHKLYKAYPSNLSLLEDSKIFYRKALHEIAKNYSNDTALLRRLHFLKHQIKINEINFDSLYLDFPFLRKVLVFLTNFKSNFALKKL